MTVLRSFEGDTWVAFLDFAGFKQLDSERAYRKLSGFYGAAYSAIKPHGRCTGLVVSDCVILWCNESTRTPREQLVDILPVIETMCRSCLNDDILVLGAVAYGDFKYERRIEHLNVQKEMFLGKAYTSAFLETEKLGKPKAGEIRLTKVPEEILDDANFQRENRLLPPTKTSKKLMFHWYLESLDSVRMFKKHWKTCSQIEFEERKRVLRQFLVSSQGESQLPRE